MTWQQAAGRYLAEVVPGAVKPATAARYIVSLGQAAPALEGRWVHEVDRRVISDLVGMRKRAGATNATIRRDLTAVSRVLAAAISWGAGETNAALDYDRTLIRERRDLIRIPTDWEVLTAVRAAPAMLGRLLMHLLQTGMRLEEAGPLEWPEVSIGRAEVQLLKTKTSKPRVVPLSEAAAGTLTGTPRHLRSRLVFWHGNGENYKNLSSNLAHIIGRVLGERAFRTHDLRHKFAVEWLRDNPDGIYRLKKILGHSSVKTTELYLAYVGDGPAEVVEEDWPFAACLRHLTYQRVMAWTGTKTGTSAAVS